MSRFIRPAVVMSLVPVIFSTFVGGCATEENRERKAMLSLQYNDFDQTYGTGFRVLYDRGEYFKGAVLIEDYLKAHRELTVGQQKFLHLHAAQLFALGNETGRAVEHLDQAVNHGKTSELGPSWNDMLAATRAFLTHDRAALLATKE